MNQYHDIPKQNPFSLYDTIGYFIPGSVFLFLLLLFELESKSETMGFFDKLIGNFNGSVFFSIAASLAFFSISYTVGQIISIASNFIIEKSNHCKLHNFLYYILLNKENINLIKDNKNLFLKIVLFYVSVYNYVFKKLGFENLEHIEPFDDLRANIIKEAVVDIMQKFYGKKSLTINDVSKLNLEKTTNYFELLYHYVLERGTNHLYKIQNYIALYGFMRNISMVFFVLFWLTLGYVVTHFLGLLKLSHLMPNILFIFVYSFFGYATILGVHKYKRRYTQEVLQAATVLAHRWSERIIHEQELINVKESQIYKE